jgi:hypothetical protein
MIFSCVVSFQSKKKKIPDLSLPPCIITYLSLHKKCAQLSACSFSAIRASVIRLSFIYIWHLCPNLFTAQGHHLYYLSEQFFSFYLPDKNSDSDPNTCPRISDPYKKRGSKSLAPTRNKYCFAGGMEITLDVEKMGQLLNLKPSLVLKDLVKESFRRDELDL